MTAPKTRFTGSEARSRADRAHPPFAFPSYIPLPRAICMHVRPSGPVFRLPLRPARVAHAMFRKALAAHSSSVTDHDFVPRQSTTRNANILLPSGLTKLNGKDRTYTTSPTAVKRTSSGLVKALRESVSFGKMQESKNNPSLVSDKSGADISDLLFNENDFDSDIDLDVEDPVTKASIQYPKLPTQTPIRKPVTYPSIQASQFHSQSHAKAATTTHPEIDDPVPASSLPLPWSSSPPEHKQTPPRNAFAQYAYTNENVQRNRVAQAKEPSTKATARLDDAQFQQPALPAIRPTKRRTLPWITRYEGPIPGADSTSESATASTTSTAWTQPTAVSHDSSVSPSYPWNTTASAIKEQQKTHRKIKLLSVDREGTDEAKALAIAKIKKGRVGRPCLSNEQRRVVDFVVEKGQSVFFTGSAGTGKSVLLREIISILRKKYSKEPDRVAITASTGLAACNIGGVTLHSFSGIGLGKEDVPTLVKKIKKNQKAMHRWLRTKYLVIDEISMVDADLFDKLEEIARQLKKNGRPFGGIKLVITGDFFQLPPVPDYGKVAKFSFDAQSWASSIDHTIGLHHVFRQKDPVFANMLNEMREGRLTQNSINTFKALSRPLEFDDALTATELFPTRNEVETANQSRMRQLHGDSIPFDARDGGTITDKQQRDKLLQNCMAPERLELKKGSQVMLIKNIDEMLVNGSLGQVIGFMNEATFDTYTADADRFHEITNANEADLNPEEQKLKRHMATVATTSQVWPMVRFTLADGNTRDLLCSREQWKVELPNGEVQASRSQIPLILAWALSIHKAQGQTLERVKVDLGKVFEKGQAYVALSRATSIKGLQVLRFDPKKVVAHDRVRTFYASLSRAENAEQEHNGAALR